MDDASQRVFDRINRVSAAAVQPMILQDARPAFERASFMDKVLELASTDGSA